MKTLEKMKQSSTERVDVAKLVQGTYGVSVSDSCVSLDLEVGGTLTSLIVGRLSMDTGRGPCSVVVLGSPSITGVVCAPSKGMVVVVSVIGAESPSSTMIGLRSSVSGGTGRVEVEYVTTGAWVLLALPIPRSNRTSCTS